ncbi:UNVERIFIED_CONTAM: Short-chain dehydrogenase reductase 2a [Sesamum latifolium]|uniref:Short-chain dehydrogenase reductase 2a n=1 Tax=Sesamum latifolium TaxID=2727402 RepID=A0AAW2XCY3_9LAMI
MLRLLIRSCRSESANRRITNAVLPLAQIRQRRPLSSASTDVNTATTAAVPRRLEGKVALITGGASGLGKATAQEFIQHGARVVIADINTQLGPQVCHQLGPEAQFVACDVSSEAQIAEAVNLTLARHGKLDIMCNNAGIAGSPFPPSIIDLDLNEFDRVMRINVRATIAGIKHAGRAMIPRPQAPYCAPPVLAGLWVGLARIHTPSPNLQYQG